MTEVTFKDFQKLMVKRKRSVDDLVTSFAASWTIAATSLSV